MPPSTILLGPIAGGLSHTSVNIWVRANAPATLYVWLATQPGAKDAKLAGEAKLTEEDGCTGTVQLTKLNPNTDYYYAVSLRVAKPAQNNFHKFTTFPKPLTGESFSFVFGSCYLPPDEYGGQTMDKIQSRIEPDGIRFGLMLGDQVYADDTKRNGLNDQPAVTLGDFRKVYEFTWSLPAMKKFLSTLPLFMIMDDHEIADDWSWKNTTHASASMSILGRLKLWIKGAPQNQINLGPERVNAGLKAFREHQAAHAPIDTKLLSDSGPYCYSFTYGKAAFFFFDTRTQRTKSKILLGNEQWTIFESWLKDVKDKYPVKFLVSPSSILYPFLLDVSKDRWSGFRTERERLFELLASNEVEGAYILTGDLHSAHAVSAELQSPNGRRISIWEFCSTPFEQKSSWINGIYIPLISKWIRRQKKHFRKMGQNFGVVHVNFENPTPKIQFDLHYNEQGWKIHTQETT